MFCKLQLGFPQDRGTGDPRGGKGATKSNRGLMSGADSQIYESTKRKIDVDKTSSDDGCIGSYQDVTVIV